LTGVAAGGLPSRMRMAFHEKIWGSTRLSPWYSDSSKKIGEVWFESDESLPLLVKFLFTSERLSVQVHPDDKYAAAHEKGSRGKTEMWHVLRADPGAPGVAAGLKERLTPQRVRELALSGEIESYLNWVEVKPGDTIFVPAGTIHAIGPGLALCEIQQHSDVTYRLYDYGRGRELHLDRSMDVAALDRYKAPAELPSGYVAWCPYFAVRELTAVAPVRLDRLPDSFQLVIALEGEGVISKQPFRQGETWHVPAGDGNIDIEPTRGHARFLIVHAPLA
jgi:mannose-6-phosphate isomerase